MAVQFWIDKSKKQIDPDLFSGKADKLAEKIFNEGSRSSKLNKPTQIRKFYDEVLRFDSLIKANPAEFETLLPYLRMLNAKAAYAMGRDLVTKGFKDFISESLNQIQHKEDFDAFVSLFESFMGYYKFYDVKGVRPPQGGRR